MKKKFVYWKKPEFGFIIASVVLLILTILAVPKSDGSIETGYYDSDSFIRNMENEHIRNTKNVVLVRREFIPNKNGTQSFYLYFKELFPATSGGYAVRGSDYDYKVSVSEALYLTQFELFEEYELNEDDGIFKL